MENALESVKEHASALEEAAMERHRQRMERVRQEIGMAINDAVDQISQACLAKQCKEQRETIQSFCEQHSADMMKDVSHSWQYTRASCGHHLH